MTGKMTQSVDTKGRSNSIRYPSGKEVTTNYRPISNPPMQTDGHCSSSTYVSPQQYYQEGNNNPLPNFLLYRPRQNHPHSPVFRTSNDLAYSGPGAQPTSFCVSKLPQSYDEILYPRNAHQMDIISNHSGRAPSKSSGPTPWISDNRLSPRIVHGHGSERSHASHAVSSGLRATAFETENVNRPGNPNVRPDFSIISGQTRYSSLSSENTGNRPGGHAPFFTPTIPSASRDRDHGAQLQPYSIPSPSMSILALPSIQEIPRVEEGCISLKQAEASIVTSPATSFTTKAPAPSKTTVPLGDLIAFLQDQVLAHLQSLNKTISTPLRSTLVTAHERHVALEFTATTRQNNIRVDLTSLLSQEERYEKRIAELYDQFVHKMTQAIDPAHVKEKDTLQRDAIQAITTARQVSSDAMICRAKLEGCRSELQSIADSMAKSSTHLTEVVLSVVTQCLTRPGASGPAIPGETNSNGAVTEQAGKIASSSEAVKRDSGLRRKNKNKASRSKNKNKKKKKKKDDSVPDTSTQAEG